MMSRGSKGRPAEPMCPPLRNQGAVVAIAAHHTAVAVVTTIIAIATALANTDST